MSTWWKTGLVSVALVGTAAADLIEKDVSQLRLRGQTRVCGETVVLSDILDFSQADPRLLAEIGDEPLASSLTPGTETHVSHDQVVRRLDELGVNLARVLVSGALRCRVALKPVGAEASPTGTDDDAPLMREQWGRFEIGRSDGGARTLADVLREHVESELASIGGTVEMEFERARQDFLELTTPPFEFSVRGGRGGKLGLREFRITIRRDGRVQRTVLIGARVKLVKQVLVAARPLSAGSYVKHDSLKYAARVFSDGRDLGFGHAEQVVGQRVKSFVPAGQMIREADLKAVDLVKRSQPVTVIGGEQVNIRITGDALDSGGYGETVRVRLGGSRKKGREVRGVVTGVGTVRLIDEAL